MSDKKEASNEEVLETMRRAWGLMRVWIQLSKTLGYDSRDITVAASTLTAMLFAGAKVDRAKYLSAMGVAFDDSGKLFEILGLDPQAFSREPGQA